MRTLLRLTLRRPVLASGAPFEQGRASLSGFAADGHGTSALDLAVERASPVLLSPLEPHSRVRHFLVDPVRAPSRPVVAEMAVGRWQPPRCRDTENAGVAWRGRSPPRLSLG
jgi:hypothetical protein